MKNVNYRTLIAAAVVAVCSLPAAAQYAPQSNTVGANGSLDQQIIGDTTANADRTQSTSNQIGNSANANGAQLSNVSDTRDQNTNNVQGGSATGGAAHGNLSDNDNRSSVGNTSSNSGGNNLSNGGNTTGGNTLSNGSSSGGNTMTGGANTAQGGSASSTGTNLGINGQQQGIDRSGNSANTNANTAAQGQGQGQGQQQANNGTNAQGQTSANTNTAGGNTGGNSANRNSMTGGAQNSAQATNAGNGAGAGAGSNNRTAMTVEGDRTENSYKSLAVAHAPIVHGPAAPAIPIANGWFAPSQCGPRHSIVKTAFEGRHMGLVFDSTFKQGDDYSVEPLEEPFIRKNGYLIGHLVNEYVAVVGTSSAKSLSAQGFGSNQSGGGAGGATSGAHQQIVVRVTIRDCVMQEKKDTPATPSVQESARTETMPIPPLPKHDRN